MSTIEMVKEEFIKACEILISYHELAFVVKPNTKLRNYIWFLEVVLILQG